MATLSTTTQPSKKTKIQQRYEQEVLDFWNEHGESTVIHAARTDVVITPKPFLGEWVNPEITRHLVKKILSNITAREIIEERVTITPTEVQLFNAGKQCLLTMPSPAVIDHVSNKVTDRIGFELSQREDTWGDRYVVPRDNGHYTFGDIMGATVKFLRDQSIPESKNPLKDIIRCLVKGKGALHGTAV